MTETVKEAAIRNADAIKAGNFIQIMADITPEAMAQMMQLGATAGAAAGVNAGTAAAAGLSMTNLPTITGYELSDPIAELDGSETITATFTSPLGSLTIASTWKQVMGRWKIAAVSNLTITPAAEA